MMVDVLDDVVWGDNASKASTSLFAGDPRSRVVRSRDLDLQHQAGVDGVRHPGR